jgi:hypothetical protein
VRVTINLRLCVGLVEYSLLPCLSCGWLRGLVSFDLGKPGKDSATFYCILFSRTKGGQGCSQSGRYETAV